jgi:hypothetical protein
LKDFISFQADSIGNGVSKIDTVEMRSIAKRKLEGDKLDDKTRDSVSYDRHDDDIVPFVNLHEDIFEVDEIVFTFSTRKNQLTNLVHIVMPCFVVSLIFCEMARTSKLDLNALCTGFTAIVFTIPIEFGVGTSIWYSKTVLIAVLLYIGDSRLAFEIEVLIFLTFPLYLVWQFFQQEFFIKSSRNAAEIRSLVKSVDDEWKKLSFFEKICFS